MNDGDDDRITAAPADSNNQWTENKVQKLDEWKNISKVYSTCHTRAYEYNEKLFLRVTNLITALGIIGTVLEGANILVQDEQCESTTSLPLSIFVLIVTALSGGLGQWLSNKNPSEIAASHEEMSKGYNGLVLNIESELTQDPSEREPGVSFIKDISSKLKDLTTGGRSIPTSIWNKVQEELVTGKIDLKTRWRKKLEWPIATVMAIPNTVDKPTHTIIDVDDETTISSSPDPNESSTGDDANLPTSEFFNPAAVDIGSQLQKYQLSRFGFG